MAARGDGRQPRRPLNREDQACVRIETILMERASALALTAKRFGIPSIYYPPYLPGQYEDVAMTDVFIRTKRGATCTKSELLVLYRASPHALQYLKALAGCALVQYARAFS